MPRVRVPTASRPAPAPPAAPLADVVQLAHGGAQGTWLALTADGALHAWNDDPDARRAHRELAPARFDRVEPALETGCGHGAPTEAFTLWSRGEATTVGRLGTGPLAVLTAPPRDEVQPVTLSDATEDVAITRDAAGLVRVMAACEPDENHHPTLVAPRPMLDVPGVTEVAAGHALACAVAEPGAVWCWAFSPLQPEPGADARDRLVRRSGPTLVPVVPVTGVVAGAWRGACGVASDGAAWCWRPQPNNARRWQVARHPWLREVARLHDAGGDLCATLRDGRFVCDPARGPAPDGALPPARVEHPGLRGAAQVVCARSLADGGCARFEDGSARCWDAIEPRGADTSVQASALTRVVQ